MSKEHFSEDHLFSEHADRVTSQMGDAERLEWQRLAAALRRCIDSSVQLSTDASSIAEWTARAEALADAMAPHSGERGVALFGGGAEVDGDAVSGGVPFSPIMGVFNPIAPPLVLHTEGDRVEGRVTLGAAYEGAPGLVHGAIISGIYDEVLALANSVNGSPGPTGRLTIHFRKPTPLHTPLRFEAWTDRVDDRKVHSLGRCFAGDTLLSEAEGLYIRIRR